MNIIFEQVKLYPKDLFLYDTVSHICAGYSGENIHLVIKITDDEVHFLNLAILTPVGEWSINKTVTPGEDLDYLFNFGYFIRRQCEIKVFVD